MKFSDSLAGLQVANAKTAVVHTVSLKQVNYGQSTATSNSHCFPAPMLLQCRRTSKANTSQATCRCNSQLRSFAGAGVTVLKGFENATLKLINARCRTLTPMDLVFAVLS